MTLSAGTRLGPYEILSPIGAGGMGEVYRARDTRLGRDVAVKVLPTAMSSSPELRQRLEREAKTISQLSHPHICTLFDVGHQDGTDYLVMEYLEGETLANRLGKGPMPIEQALRIGIEIAGALDAAHRSGIVHRDLKPGNVMLTKSGVKLLDFGLAKLAAPQPGAVSQATSLPTALQESEPLTTRGTILGTFQYMAPEQLEGREADARSDIFSLGCVLYEMLTGHKAFTGKSQASLISSIMSSDPPPISTLQPLTPPTLDRIVRKCLAKDPDARWHSAHDLHDELVWVVGETVTATPRAVSVAKARGRLAWWLVGVSSVVALAAMAWVATTYFGHAPADVRTLRYAIFPPDGWRLSLANRPGAPTPLVLSPDGRRLAFVVRRAEGDDVIWVRDLDALTARPLTGTEGASSIFWSPDSRFLGFFVGQKLKTIDVAGGPATTLCELPVPGAGGTWGRDGVILFSAGVAPLQKVSASGGVPVAATTLGKGEAAHFRPWFLPDGRHFLYSGYSAGLPALPVFVGSLDSAERVRLVESSSTNAVYAQGHVLFLRDTTLMAQPFDVRRLALNGDAFPVAEQIQPQGIQPAQGVFSVSESGILVYQTGTMGTGRQLIWFDRTGKPLATVGDQATYADVALSPDGKRAVVYVGTPGDLWTVDLARGLRTRFTFNPAVFSGFPVWSRDGTRIAFASTRYESSITMYQKASNGVGAEEPLLADNVSRLPSDWSPDGRFLLYETTLATFGNTDVWVWPFVEDRKPFPWLSSAFNESGAKFSSDGRWIAYMSDESGRSEVYVSPFVVPANGASAAVASAQPSGKWQVSTGGGLLPKWRGDGKEIAYFEERSGRLMAVSVNGQGPAFDVGAAEPLFTLGVGAAGPFRLSQGTVRDFFDMTRDGQRFLVNVPTTDTPTSGPPPITVVVNWAAAPKR
jgi:eukaryotic-like serine/threonine-protein kinase